ncbi:MAG: site-specific DNA-methyltransferase [Pseudomonadota bacterium]|nr:site-specific DNA-methyltransferase [Pseudomonadota bacterium]
MDKLKMHTPDFTQANVATLAELFPGCVSEARGEDGEIKRAIDFDLLRQELSEVVVDGPRERYQLDWPGKRAALLAANAPIAKTLWPVRETSLSFDDARHLLIEGDNLEVLKLLQETYLNRVKMIYIDPPYNTGRDFIYDDDFSQRKDTYFQRSNQDDAEGNRLVANTEANGRFHSDWLSMLYPRLKLARNLLRDDGVVFISIDDNELQGLRQICTEIFGEQNFVATIIWQKVYAPKNSANWFSEDHDYILVFAKSKEHWRPNQLARTEEMESRYKNLDNDPRGPWKAENMTARNPYDAGVYPVTSPSGRVVEGPPRGTYWRISEEKFRELDSDDRIWWGEDGNNTPAVKKFLSEVSSGRTPQTLWFYKEVGHTQDAKKTLLKYVPFEHTENVLNSVKPVELIQRMLQLGTDPDDDTIVLDFFSGSAATAHAVLIQNCEDGGNRRFVGVQVAEPLPKPEPEMASIFDMGRLRVRNVIAELTADDGVNADTLGFRILKIGSSNMKDVYYTPDALHKEDLFGLVDNIKPGRTPEDLLFQVLLDWGVDLTLPIARETLAGKQVFFVDTDALAACFDKGVDGALVKAIAKRKPLRVVFRDTGFTEDSMKINAEQIFKTLSPGTEVKSI